MASRQMEVGALSRAQRWLAWSDWLDPGDGRTDLMRAACFRHQRRFDLWPGAVQSAERKGTPAGQVQQELRLGLIQSGEPREGVEQEWAALIEAGVSPHEVATAFIHRYLSQEDPENAKVVLDGWSTEYPEDAQVAYMAGVYWRWRSEPERAETEFQHALEREPRHELARQTLAELLEEQHRLGEALAQRVELATRSGDPGPERLSVARLLRKLGRLDEAQAVLGPLVSRPEFSSPIAVEMGQIELERGNYEKAQRQFEQGGLDQMGAPKVLSGAACAFGLDGETIPADRLLALHDATVGRSARIYDLRSRLAVAPNDKEASAELNRMFLPSTRVAAGVDRPGISGATAEQQSVAQNLYALHCTACHGTSGDGNGRAARHLFPRPRDLRTGKARLVSTENGIPTLEDVESSLKHGMPGTAMRSFENLSMDERNLLAQEVLRLNREGVHKQLVDTLSSEGEAVDTDEVREAVQFCTTPGEAARVPRFAPADPQAIVRGRATYVKLGCDNCHGEEGSGASDVPLFDEKGRPSPPRDLAHEPFKGGGEPESIYLRIFLGMPGTPHPACPNVGEKQLIDVVHYCRSLSQEPKKTLTNHQRAIQATGRAYLAGPAACGSDEARPWR